MSQAEVAVEISLLCANPPSVKPHHIDLGVAQTAGGRIVSIVTNTMGREAKRL